MTLASGSPHAHRTIVGSLAAGVIGALCRARDTQPGRHVPSVEPCDKASQRLAA